jgi:hypothetical protein
MYRLPKHWEEEGVPMEAANPMHKKESTDMFLWI